MSAEAQGSTDQTELEWPTFESVYEKLVKLTASIPTDRKFPNCELKNRLLNIGLQEFLESHNHKNESGRALELHGFPFKLVSQLDEATLATAQFLHRFSEQEGSSLSLFALHRLSKGEEKTLAFWQTPKAKLYIELQNLILLLNNVGGRTSTISRIFTFSKVEDLAFLTQPAINVLSEQLAIGVDIGFLFLDSFEKVGDQDIGSISNTVLLDFLSAQKKSALRKNKRGTDPATDIDQALDFFALRGVLEEKKAHDLPYQDRCTAQWYSDKEVAVQHDQQLSNFIQLFDRNKWQAMTAKPTGVCGFPEDGGAVFNRATLMMYQAFNRGRTHINPEDFRRRVNETVITRDLIRLERTMAAFDKKGINDIKAVDATSVKDSLRVHESNPTYRQWLRRSLNHVLADRRNSKTLSRIYILEDRKPKDSKAIEFQTLAREMQYYLDYLNYEMSEMSQIIFADGTDQRSHSQREDALIQKCNSLRNRINVYVTTSSTLYNFANDVLEDDHAVMIKEILRSPYEPESSASIASIKELLPTLDYLFTDGRRGMVYNFVNQLADPGELRFEASLYRSTLNIKKEIQLLFDFIYQGDTFSPEEPSDLEAEKALDKLRNEQRESRIDFMLQSIREYAEKYQFILEKELPKRKRSYANLKKKIASVDVKTKPETLLQIRRTIESTLYEYFAPKFAHLYDLLKYCSVEVNFFRTSTKTPSKMRLAVREVKDVYPFNVCQGSKPFETPVRTPSDDLHLLLKGEIRKRLRDKESIPRFHANSMPAVRKVNTSSKRANHDQNRTFRTSSEPLPAIGIITALPEEFAAVNVLLENGKPYSVPGKGAGRRYSIGEIPASEGTHLIALAMLADMGNNSAATRATQLMGHFKTVDTIIMVGIAGGVPYPQKSEEHVRLGDLVVSDRLGVIQYDYIKDEVRDEFVVNEARHPPRPPNSLLLEAVRYLRVSEIQGNRPWLPLINQALKTLNVSRPSATTDVLTSSVDPTVPVDHPDDPKRDPTQPRVFSGPIASANVLLRNPIRRDQLRDQFHVKAVEMEGSGIADATWQLDAGYLVVRGITDYCDPNKGDMWRQYAAIVAAAYARALLESIPMQLPGVI